MKKYISGLIILAVFFGLSVSPTGAAALSGSVDIFTTAVCKDTATVAVSGSSDWATNRVKVSFYKQDSNGNYNWFANATSDTFGSGSFVVPVVADYSTKAIPEGTSLRIDVELQHQSGSGGGFYTAASTSTYLTAADKLCFNKCSVTITSRDKAPASGTITLRSHFGSWFRPEGWLHAAIPVNANQFVKTTIVGVPCDWTVRAWYYPSTGSNRTPKLLPSQYWPGDFAASTSDGALPYAAAFANGLVATKPLESDDPYAPK
ncbi:MAG TPA: hypothetical protein VFF70_13635 [Anaerolineae bacterium]|nr:hypothetical protein [Anaerolineae bacterium]